MIRLEGISKFYPATRALDQISFDVRAGTVHGFLGPNGAGKSTTMNIISGLLRPTEGSITIDDQLITEKTTDHARSKVGFLPETPPLYGDMTVLEYLSFVGKLHKLSSAELIHRIDYTLDKVGLRSVSKRLISNLSKGYKQRVGVAQAIIFNPPIIILDEPTVGLDPKAIQDMRSLIRELKADHTILLSTHLLHEVAQLCDDISIIDKGKILVSGPMKKVLKELEHGQIYTALVQSWEAKWEESLLQESFVKKVEVIMSEEGHQLKIFTHTIEDQRSRLLRMLFDFGTTPLEFKAEDKQLEDFFFQITGKDQ
jgi:ABC-2 type transport system ATP-binding protein